MNEREVLSRLRAANPVSRMTTLNDDVGAVDHLLRSLERRGEMPTNVKTEGVERTGVTRRRLRPLGAAAVAVLVVAVGLSLAVILRGGEPKVSFAAEGVPAGEARAVAGLVEAYNARDLEGFRKWLAPGATFPTSIAYDTDAPIGRDSLPELRLELDWARAIGQTIEVRSCEPGGIIDVVCRVTSRWSVLRYQEALDYQFDFAPGGRISSIGLAHVPDEPTVPEGWLTPEEHEEFRSWVRGLPEGERLGLATPREPVEVDGIRVLGSVAGFYPDPDNVEEIEALLQEWMASR